jgi:uncharacterized protein YicC (UPF0701 family)
LYWQWEIKSVTRKVLDIRCRLPGLRPEAVARSTLASTPRGNLQVTDPKRATPEGRCRE